MTYQDIISRLHNKNYSPIILLQGDEPYFIDQISNFVEKNVLSDAEKGFNQTILYGKDTTTNTILEHAKRYPMMSERQVVIIKEAQDLKLAKEGSRDLWLEYMQSPLQSTILVLCHKYKKVDKRSALYKAIDKNGIVFDSEKIREDKIPAWVEDYLKSKKLAYSKSVPMLIAECLGNNLSTIANELDKMLLNINGKHTIDEKDIEDNIGISKEYNVFELQKALTKKDFFKTMQIIDYFNANPKSNPLVMVLSSLNSFFTKILLYHYSPSKDQQSIASLLGVHPYFAREYEVAAKNFPLAKVFETLSILRKFDLKIKGVESGNTEQDELLKEMILRIW